MIAQKRKAMGLKVFPQERNIFLLFISQFYDVVFGLMINPFLLCVSIIPFMMNNRQSYNAMQEMKVFCVLVFPGFSDIFSLLICKTNIFREHRKFISLLNHKSDRFPVLLYNYCPVKNSWHIKA